MIYMYIDKVVVNLILQVSIWYNNNSSVKYIIQYIHPIFKLNVWCTDTLNT